MSSSTCNSLQVVSRHVATGSTLAQQVMTMHEPISDYMQLPSLAFFKAMFAESNDLLNKTVESAARQQQQMELYEQRLQLESLQIKQARAKQNKDYQLERKESQKRMLLLDAAQKKQSEQWEACGNSIKDIQKAVHVQGSKFRKDMDAILLSQSSGFPSFPLQLKQMFALMVSNLMDSKNGFVVCFPTVTTDDRGTKNTLFMICIPLLMQGMLLFDKVLAKKNTIVNWRNLISIYLPFVHVSDAVYEVAHRTFPCTQYKGQSGRTPTKAQKDKYCVIIHEDALLPVLRQAQLHIARYGFHAGTLPRDVANKDFQKLPGKNQFWIGKHSDAHLGNWGERLDVVKLQARSRGYTEFVKLCLQIDGSSSSSSAVDQTYYFNGLTLSLRKTRANAGAKSPSQGLLHAPGASGSLIDMALATGHHLAPRKQPSQYKTMQENQRKRNKDCHKRSKKTGGTSAVLSHKEPRVHMPHSTVAIENAQQQVVRKRKEREESHDFFATLADDDADFEDEGLRRVVAKACSKEKGQKTKSYVYVVKQYNGHEDFAVSSDEDLDSSSDTGLNDDDACGQTDARVPEQLLPKSKTNARSISPDFCSKYKKLRLKLLK